MITGIDESALRAWDGPLTQDLVQEPGGPHLAHDLDVLVAVVDPRHDDDGRYLEVLYGLQFLQDTEPGEFGHLEIQEKQHERFG